MKQLASMSPFSRPAFSALLSIALAGMFVGLLANRVTRSEAIALAASFIVVVGVVIALSRGVRAHGAARPYQTFTLGSAGTPVIGPVTYTSFVHHDLKLGMCTISEFLEAGAELEEGLVESRILYRQFSIPPAKPETFQIASEFAAECDATAADSYVDSGLLSDSFRDVFRQSGYLLSTRLAMVNVFKDDIESGFSVENGFILIDTERRTAFHLLPGPESITVSSLEHYPDELKLERYLVDLGWRLIWQHDRRFRFERNQKPIPLALPWLRLTIELEVPIFLPQYESDADEAKKFEVDYVYHSGAGLLEPDQDSYVLFDMPIDTVLSSFPQGQVLPAPESGRMRWRVPVGRSTIEMSGRTGEAGLVRMKLINARLARIGLGSLALRRPSALVYTAIGVVAGNYAEKVLDLVVEPVAKGFVSWITNVLL